MWTKSLTCVISGPVESTIRKTERKTILNSKKCWEEAHSCLFSCDSPWPLVWEVRHRAAIVEPAPLILIGPFGPHVMFHLLSNKKQGAGGWNMAAARRPCPKVTPSRQKCAFSLYSLARVCPRTFSAVFRHIFNSVAVGNFVEMFSHSSWMAPNFHTQVKVFALSTPNFRVSYCTVGR